MNPGVKHQKFGTLVLGNKGFSILALSANRKSSDDVTAQRIAFGMEHGEGGVAYVSPNVINEHMRESTDSLITDCVDKTAVALMVRQAQAGKWLFIDKSTVDVETANQFIQFFAFETLSTDAGMNVPVVHFVVDGVERLNAKDWLGNLLDQGIIHGAVILLISPSTKIFVDSLGETADFVLQNIMGLFKLDEKPPLIQIENESIASFVAKTIAETLLPLRSVLVYPHFAGTLEKEGGLVGGQFHITNDLANEIASELRNTGQSAQRFSIGSWIDSDLLGTTISYEDDGTGCMVAKVSPAMELPKRLIKVATFRRWRGPVFCKEGDFKCVLIPSLQRIDPHKPARTKDALLGDLRSAISPSKRHDVHMQAFEIHDEKFGSWIFAHARWSDATNAEVEARRKAEASLASS